MYLSIIFDLVIVGIFVFCIYSCAKKGLVGSSYKIASLVLTIVLMLMFQDTICTQVKNSPLGEKINQTVSEALSEKVEESTQEEQKQGFLEGLGLPGVYLSMFDNSQAEIEKTKNQIISEITESICASVINIISVIILYIAVRILLFIFFKVTNLVLKLPVLKTFNKLLGAVFGVIQALLVVYILCAVLMWFVPAKHSEGVVGAIEESVVTEYFYNNNMILKVLGK